MSNIHTVIKIIGCILSFDLLFTVIVWCDVSLYLWFGNNRTRRTVRGNWQNATYPWVDLVYKLWIFLHVVLIGGFFIVLVCVVILAGGDTSWKRRRNVGDLLLVILKISILVSERQIK